ncbi:hypothetical protein LINGRAHAP2_LOCUS14798 [Linum grandiflorum]
MEHLDSIWLAENWNDVIDGHAELTELIAETERRIHKAKDDQLEQWDDIVTRYAKVNEVVGSAKRMFDSLKDDEIFSPGVSLARGLERSYAPARKKRRCRLCGVPGHKATTCHCRDP